MMPQRTYTTYDPAPAPLVCQYPLDCPLASVGLNASSVPPDAETTGAYPATAAL